jgi:hypothetical protein
MSAGGAKDEMTARRFQYRVREPYAPPGKTVELVGGFLERGRRLTMSCQVRDAAVFLDGSHVKVPVGMGDVVEVTGHPSALRLVRPR